MKKIKKNKKGSKGSKGNKRVRAARYPVEYLGIALLALVLIETALLGNVTGTDVASAFGMFDSSSQIAEAQQALTAAVEPMLTMVSDINKFYELAATETARLLDASEHLQGTTEVAYAYGKFVGLVPDYSSQVAGISVESCQK